MLISHHCGVPTAVFPRVPCIPPPSVWQNRWNDLCRRFGSSNRIQRRRLPGFLLLFSSRELPVGREDMVCQTDDIQAIWDQGLKILAHHCGPKYLRIQPKGLQRTALAPHIRLVSEICWIWDTSHYQGEIKTSRWDSLKAHDEKKSYVRCDGQYRRSSTRMALNI